ncbi:MAG: pyrroline-5-carboxylate reductase [Treponema sp.]|nr:pyrroline-5-carboxylate reductase [Treponema sp.]
MEKLGFIGMGNMAQALAGGFLKSGLVASENVFAYAPNYEKLCKNAEKIGFNACKTLNDVVSACDTLIMACKPYQIEGVLKEIRGSLMGKTLVSVAAGWDYAKYAAVLSIEPSPVTGEYCRFQFVMPNTPALVGEGVLLFEEKNSLDEAEKAEIIKLFEATGTVAFLPSNLMGIGGAVTGCGPAFVDLFMEAYADAAVKYGIPRPTAYKLISQMVLGSAKLQKDTGEHPGVLKDNVCSPNGTTIRGVATLEEKGFRNACIKSIDAIMDFKKN